MAHQGAFWSWHAQCGTVAHAHPYSHTIYAQLCNNNKQMPYEEASLVLWYTEQWKEILEVTWEKRQTHSNYERKRHHLCVKRLGTREAGDYSRLSWLIVSPRSQQWRKRQLHWRGQQPDPEIQFHGAKQGRPCGWSLTAPWEDSVLDPGDGESITFSDGNKRKMPYLYWFSHGYREL